MNLLYTAISTTARQPLPSLTGGVWGWVFCLLVVALLLFLFLRHQRALRRRALLMREAIRNRDWSFKLTTRGLSSGERAMQETLNDLGEVIHQQVNRGEVESWERLTRVLTHEIMNSTAPIASISQSLLRRDDVVGTPLEAGIRTIHATAARLTTFVDSYRKLSQLQQASPEMLALAPFFEEIRRLYPSLTWDIPDFGDATVFTDPVLLQQVVVNLVKNAVEAGAKRIKTHPLPSLIEREHIPSQTERIAAFRGNHSLPMREGGGRVLLISNDGAPIPASIRDNIFVPFFTTKHAGTGIGLSLSRQILVRQGGDLELSEQSATGYTTTFRITLPGTI